MNVLSLFDGMSCGQLALNRTGLKYDNYYASEIDKYAIAVAVANYPKTIQLGNVVDIRADALPKIDLLIGGSPCQGFSFAGKQLNFNDPRSALFFEYVRLLKELNPKYFLLENVKMKKEYQDVISGQLGVQPIEINSALVSAQNRKRLYWTNIPNVKQPQDKGILLKDILEDGENKICAKRGRYVNSDPSQGVYQNTEIREDNKSNTSTAVQKDNLIWVDKNKINNPKALPNYIQYDVNGKGHGSQDQCAFYPEGKHGTLDTGCRNKSKCVRSGGRHSFDKHEWDSIDNLHIRKLTVIECERLQTIPDNYTNHVSMSQRYKMIGNGWTIDVIAHILKNIPQIS